MLAPSGNSCSVESSCCDIIECAGGEQYGAERSPGFLIIFQKTGFVQKLCDLVMNAEISAEGIKVNTAESGWGGGGRDVGGGLKEVHI